MVRKGPVIPFPGHWVMGNQSVVRWHEVTQMFVMFDYAREMTVSCYVSRADMDRLSIFSSSLKTCPVSMRLSLI